MKEQKPVKNKVRFPIPKGLLTFLIIIIAVAAVVAVDFYKRSNYSPFLDFDSKRTKGSKDAPIKILEFVDFPCENCAEGSRVLERYMQDYPGGIQLSIRYFPLNGINSTISALYAQCAAEQNKFWPFHDLLFERQDEWGTYLRVKPQFEAMASEAGMDLAKLNKCIERDDVKQLIAKDKEFGQSLFVRSTPTYFINEQIVVGVERLRMLLRLFFEMKRSSD